MAALIPEGVEAAVAAEEAVAPFLSRVGSWALASAKGLIKNPFFVPAAAVAFKGGEVTQGLKDKGKKDADTIASGISFGFILIAVSVALAIFLRLRGRGGGRR